MVLKSMGSNHVSFGSADAVIRLTTDAALSYIDREAPFVLTRPLHLVIGPDEPFPADPSTTCRSFAARTQDYWTEWVRRLSIAYDWQDVIIRAAITLKLSSFEETGGIIAAHTTSIPEAPGSSGRERASASGRCRPIIVECFGRRLRRSHDVSALFRPWKQSSWAPEQSAVLARR
jgi:hypothetical protein